jgi:hypothetical protein
MEICNIRKKLTFPMVVVVVVDDEVENRVVVV